MVDPLLIASLLVATGSAAGTGAVAWWVSRRSTPAELLKTRAMVDDAVARVDAVELRVTKWKAELDDTQEVVLDALQRAEQKRNRAVVAESRQRQREAQEQQQAPATRDDVVTLYRRKLYGGQ